MTFIITGYWHNFSPSGRTKRERLGEHSSSFEEQTHLGRDTQYFGWRRFSDIYSMIIPSWQPLRKCKRVPIPLIDTHFISLLCRFFFATTNHKSLLDPALVRRGRMDVHIEFKHVEKFPAKQLFVKTFTQTCLDQGKLEKLADTFAELASRNEVSVLHLLISRMFWV